MSITRHHNDWLRLVPNSGPFLSLPVLARTFPQGLDAHDAEHARRLRLAFDEWDDNQLGNRPDPGLHRAWIKFVLGETLGYDELLAEGQEIPQSLKSDVAEYGETLRPDWIVNDPATKKPRLLVQAYPRSQSLTKPVATSRWKTSPDTRMMQLLHDTGIRLGIVTNGDHWMLVNAPKNETTGYASWYANLWLEEPVTLRAFRTVLGADRLFSVPDDQTLEALLDKSASDQQEVTDQLGYQVRKAVEVLIQALDKADQDHGRKLLADVDEKVLYESALTVMMRLVFLFCAEERELLLLGDELYDKNYAVSTLREQLRSLAEEEVHERRYDAWCRLLTTFRAVYAGAKHDRLKLPAYGGSLFDPDRFPFLEGRKLGTSWKSTEATPLPVSNRTVLHLLEALQVLQTKVGKTTEARNLSFRSLDIEQIGHVYEGLLDHTAQRATEPVLGLAGTRDKEPEISLATLEREAWGVDRGANMTDEERRSTLHAPSSTFLKFLKDETGRSESALKKALNAELEDQLVSRFRTACQDSDLWNRVKPFAGLVRLDTVGYPVVIPPGSVFVTGGTDRRSSGTHYTPKSLTEPIVQYTLEPLVYVGPAEGLPKEQWKLRSAKELLDLKICDMACGSGAFLVQACRYMAARLLEAWDAAEREAWGEDRGAKGESDERTELSGTGSVERGDGPGLRMLPGDEDFPEGRNFRNDQSDSSGGGVDPGEHRRGPGAGTHEGVPESSEHRQRVAQGTGNPSAALSASRASHGATVAAADDTLRASQSDVVPPATGPRKAPLNRSTARGPRSTIPRITPHGSRSTGSPGEMLIPDDPDERQTYALRIVAQRCMYGVDKNPLAAEMAKLSLWLLTLAKDKPFEFLDHAIRCGDSLVGIHNTEQLRKFNLDGKGEDNRLFLHFLDEKIKDAIALRRQITEMQANTVEDVEAQDRMLREANEKIDRLKCAADMLIAAEFVPGSTADKRAARDDAAIKVAVHFHDTDLASFRRETQKALCGQVTFHWPLEFPEVMVEEDGFAAFVGNPPFMGGSRISSSFEKPYAEYLLDTNPHCRGLGRVDLCAFFFLRGFQLGRNPSCLGFIATNTIAQGDTRVGCLEYILQNDGLIFHAVKSRAWPGYATVEVSLVYTAKQMAGLPRTLDGSPVSDISSTLEAGVFTSGPTPLASNKGLAFRGSMVAGEGFVIDHDLARSYVSSDKSNHDVIFPYLTGEDLNQRLDQSPSRSIIDFGDRTEDESRKYREPFERVESLVKAQRFAGGSSDTQKRWWQFGRRAVDLYQTIKDFDRVLVSSQVSKHFVICCVDTGVVFSSMLVVFAFEEWGHFALLQSFAHEAWARRYGSSMRTDLRYTPSDCFETFPFPKVKLDLDDIGHRYHQHRKLAIQHCQVGMTTIYNRFHNSDETSADIQKLRQLHIEMDNAVAAAYGWTDLDLGHGFHETKQGVRYTISEPARREVLARLLKLNHERYAEEVKQGLHEKKKGRGARGEGRGKKKQANTDAGASLFKDEEDDT